MTSAGEARLTSREELALLRSLRSAPLLPDYATDTVSVLYRMIEHHWYKRVRQIQEHARAKAEARRDLTEGERTALAIQSTVLERIKRVLLAYHSYRLHRILQQRFEHGPKLPSELAERMCPEERKYRAAINRALRKYARAVPDGELLSLAFDGSAVVTPGHLDGLRAAYAPEQPGVDEDTIEATGGLKPGMLYPGGVGLLRAEDYDDLLRRGKAGPLKDA